jgi:hypothetical protein
MRIGSRRYRRTGTRTSPVWAVVTVALLVIGSFSCGQSGSESEALIASLADSYECQTNSYESGSVEKRLRGAEEDLNNPEPGEGRKSTKITLDQDAETADVQTTTDQLGSGIRYKANWTLSGFKSTGENTVSLVVTYNDDEMDELEYSYEIEEGRVRLTLLEGNSTAGYPEDPYPWTEVLAATTDGGVVAAAKNTQTDSIAVWACRAE